MGYEVYFHKDNDKAKVLMSLMRANPHRVYSFRIHGGEVERGIIVDIAGADDDLGVVIGGWDNEEMKFSEVNIGFIPFSSFNKVRTVNMEDTK
jgi:hypothetical protein